MTDLSCRTELQGPFDNVKEYERRRGTGTVDDHVDLQVLQFVESLEFYS